jgi:hypothetical protein
MKVEITDDKVFNALSPKDLQNYLISKDWQCIKKVDNTFSIWELINNELKYKIWLPEDYTLGDFSHAMSRTIKTLAIAENRSQLELLEDIDTLTIGDVVRVRTFDPMNTNSSSLPFEYGLSVIQRARNLVIAGACATVEKKALFPARKYSQVADYSKTLRLGQTERGSFITKIISPIEIKQKEIFNIAPFERQSIITMLEGLDALHYVANETIKRGRFYFEPFEETVSHGVSALLCEAVTGELYEQGYQQTEINVSWFYNELINKPTINKTHLLFSTNMMPYIREAAYKFYEKEPEDLIIEGYVITLDREKSKGDGIITILHIDDYGKKRKIKAKLYEHDYNNATDAHRDGLPIECKGSITKEGRSFVVNYPENFHVVVE